MNPRDLIEIPIKMHKKKKKKNYNNNNNGKNMKEIMIRWLPVGIAAENVSGGNRRGARTRGVGGKYFVRHSDGRIYILYVRKNHPRGVCPRIALART